MVSDRFFINFYNSLLIHKRFLKNLIQQNKATEEELKSLKSSMNQKSIEFEEQLRSLNERNKKELEEQDLKYSKKVTESADSFSLERESIRKAAFTEGFEKGQLAEAEKGKIFSVAVRPYMGKFIKKGLIKNSTKLYIGYQYQLLVSGIPCFQPHKVHEQEYEEEIIDDEKIAKYTKLAIEVAEAAVRLSAGPAATLIPVNRQPVIEEI